MTPDTERKCADEALRETEERYRQLLDVSPHIPWIADTEGNLVDISSRWLQLTGLSKEQRERKNPGVWRCGFRGISGKLLKWQNFINSEWYFGM